MKQVLTALVAVFLVASPTLAADTSTASLCATLAPTRTALDGFAAQMRSSGFVKASLEKAGLQQAASVASGDAH